MGKLNLVGSYRVGSQQYGPGNDVEVPDDTADAIKEMDAAKRKQYEQDAKFAQTMLPAGHPYLALQGITNNAQPPQFEGEATAPPPIQSELISDPERQRLQDEGEAQRPAGAPARAGGGPDRNSQAARSNT